ncbi:tyrosine-type recombinase/integrase [Undibacterium baiyunense]|uniref:Tyrosine-type recombinase/integrase n=1 Tax=Undibacterium baiyunense TaxID=2828731 RepID=A0A941DBP2_9BURK|nr:tyrosine-type recombinase/integrase [Undibacterium baiyunense]MBR7745151.1 tyrosine-type recombinase/integrase [Undibacterium baiyunense]
MIIQNYDASFSQSLTGPILIDASGLPRYWSAVWSTMCAGRLADSTHIKKLRYIENLYHFADISQGPGSLDDALGALDDRTLASILESWFISIRNQPTINASNHLRWQTGLAFVTFIVQSLAKGDGNNRMRNIEGRLRQLSVLYSQFRIKKRNSPETIRSLPASIVQTLYSILAPDSDLNPFPRLRTRWRVYVAFILMLHQGLRRGEILLLPADAVKSDFDIKRGAIKYWINIQGNRYEDSSSDHRHSRPGIKTRNSVRQIPISESVAQIIEAYAQNHRGRPTHSYLLNSPSNAPLSTEALTKAFALISARLPKAIIQELEVRTGKTSITPHDLRHTCAVAILSRLLMQGDSMDEALQKMRTFFGWSRESTMPSRYAKAVFEDRLASVWNDAFDDRVELLRSISKG